MNQEIYSDDQYVIDTSLDASRLEHASNLKEVTYGFFHRFLIDNDISKQEALRMFETLKKRESDLQEEMLGLINQLK